MKKEDVKEEFDIDKFVDFVIAKWKTKKYKFDKTKAREYIEIMLFLMNEYRLKCLLRTIIDLDDLLEEYEEVK